MCHYSVRCFWSRVFTSSLLHPLSLPSLLLILFSCLSSRDVHRVENTHTVHRRCTVPSLYGVRRIHPRIPNGQPALVHITITGFAAFTQISLSSILGLSLLALVTLKMLFSRCSRIATSIFSPVICRIRSVFCAHSLLCADAC